MIENLPQPVEQPAIIPVAPDDPLDPKGARAIRLLIKRTLEHYRKQRAQSEAPQGDGNEQ